MNASSINRLVLIGPSRLERDAKVRRYRLARLKLDGDTRSRGESPYAHLRRVYD
jgi:hypothetical protein